MKLKTAKGKLQNPILGIHASIIRDDLIGSTLVIEGGSNVLNVRLVDLVDFIQAQEAEEAKEVKADVPA